MRILLVSQMYPGPDDPDLGVFVAQMERALADRGHEIARAVVDRRDGGKLRHPRLLRNARAVARTFHPDVLYAHFLVPAGFAAALASRAPLVVTAHGQDVANIGRGSASGAHPAGRPPRRRGGRRLRLAARRARGKVPEASGKVEVVDCGVDLERFRPSPPRTARPPSSASAR